MAAHVTLYAAASLDGFIADEKGGVGWLDRIPEQKQDADVYTPFLETVDAIVMGRVSYEQCLTFGDDWVYGDKKCVVLTRSGCKSGAVQGDSLPIPAVTSKGQVPNVRLESWTPSQAVQCLQEEGVRHIWLLGGGALNASFLEEACIHDIELYIVPCLLQRGIPLFSFPPRSKSASKASGSVSTPDWLVLQGCEAQPSGMVRLRYKFRRHETEQAVHRDSPALFAFVSLGVALIAATVLLRRLAGRQTAT